MAFALLVAGAVFVAVSYFPAYLREMYVADVGLTPLKVALEFSLNGTLDQVLALLKREGGGIFLLDEQGATLRLAAHHGLSAASVEEYTRQPTKLGEGWAGRAAVSGEPVPSDDAVHDRPVEQEVLKTSGLSELVGVPIKAKGKVLGVLGVFGAGPEAPGPEDVALLATIGQELGLAIENARLYPFRDGSGAYGAEGCAGRDSGAAAGDHGKASDRGRAAK